MTFSRTSLIMAFLITMLSGILITNYFVSITREPIRQIRVKKHAQKIQQLMPLNYDNNLLNDRIKITALGDLGTSRPVSIYRARILGQSITAQPIGVVILPVAPDGYNGSIKLAVSMNYQGGILKVNILKHKETREFGDQIHQDISDWINGFTGKTSIDLAKISDLDQISGASVSSAAVTEAVIKCLAFYQREKDRIWEQKIKTQ